MPEPTPPAGRSSAQPTGAVVTRRSLRAGRSRPRWRQLLGPLLVWAALATAVTVLVLFVLVPRLAGATPYTVLTGSMRPDLPPGELIVVRPVPFERIAAGDVVTYQIRSGRPEVVTHRVVGIEDVDGSPRLRTQGDANPDPDPALVRPEQVRGRLWYSAPYLGHAATALSTDQRTWVIRAAGLGLLGYAAFLLTGALMRCRR